MKFYCDACNTKYAISDDKVRGKVLKVRCKNCGNVVTVRENKAPQAESSKTRPATSRAPTPAAAPVPTTNWYYALNGETSGPFTLEVLRQRYASAQVSDASYVWHETFTEWKPVATVPAFADALASGYRIRPAQKTLGFTSQKLQAVGSAAAPSPAREGAVPPAAKPKVERPRPAARETPPPRPTPARPRSPEVPAPGASRPALRNPVHTPSLPPNVRERPAVPSPKPDVARPKRPTPAPTEPRALQDARQDKLERLRERLTSDSSNPLAAIAAPTPTRDEPARAHEAHDTAIDSFPKPISDGPVLTFAPGTAAEPQQPAPAEPRAVDASDFDFGSAPSSPAATPRSSTSDILGSSQEEPADSGVIVFPDAPTLKGSAGTHAPTNTSESLLVELSSMQKQGRGKRFAGIAVAALALLGVLGLAGYQFSKQPPEAPAAPPRAATAADEPDELVIRRYSKDEQGKISMLELEEERLAPVGEGAAAEVAEATPTPDERPAADDRGAASAAGARGVARPTTAEKTAPRVASGEAVAAREQTEPQPDEPPSESDILKSLLQPRASAPVIRPKDRLREQAETTTGLSKDEARKGFKRVKDSVRICRERHNRHNAALSAQKIKVGIKVQPTGKVSDFNVQPRSVQNTEFDRCMQSHRERWRFASFQGEAVVINTSIVLQ